MIRNWLYAALVCCTLCMVFTLAEDVTTEKVESKNITTPKPSIDIINSALCKKCSCDKDNKQLDCSNKSLTSWFSDEEWNILQNGDLTFEIINLEHNNLKEIPLLHTYPVKHLYLGFNDIANITNAAFSNLTELTTLDLSHNKLTSKVLVPDVFKGQFSKDDWLPLGNVRELNLGYNALHNLDSDLFEHVPKLEVLILCKNTFQVIDQLSEIAIAGLHSLKTLDLSYMEIDELPDKMFHGPRDLETLILTGNLFDEIPEEVVLAVNLKHLVLDENLMKNFTNDNVFPELKNLQYLSISYLPELDYIGKGAFSNLQNLTELILTNNPKLTFIDTNAFAKATDNPEIFDYPPLEKLYLHNNNITKLDHDMLVRWDKIKTIDLRNNPWDCDCSNHWLIHTLMTQINTTSPVLTKAVDCNLPAAWKNIPLMDLNSNKNQLICSRDSHPESDSLVLVGLLIGVLIGIPLTLGTLVLYRRGCFGLLNRGNSAGSKAIYNRASFTDDFHI